jgi:wobble nucleotide-excising tRNase
MIKRIKKINQIGSFYNCIDTGKFDFTKVTIFHGWNTYGKSTLTDIFNSIAENQPSYITNRKSIPISSEKQEIELTYLKDEKEESLNFNGNWSNTDLQGRLFVFDSNFVHKNLISGIVVTRENRVSFTDFILGEEGVTLSKTISERKKQLANDKANLKDIRPTYTKNFSDSDVDTFVNLNVVEKKEELENLISKEKKILENIGRVNQIKQLPTVSPVNTECLFELEKINEELNKILGLDFKGFTEEIKTKFLEHLNLNTTNNSTTEDWLREGFQKHMKTTHDVCPFCSQKIESNLNILDVYSDYFNDEYGKYITNEINTPLEALKNRIGLLNFDSILTDFQEQVINLSKYKNYSEEVEDDIDYSKLSGLIEGVKPQLAEYKKRFIEKINEKKIAPHKAVDEIQLGSELKKTLASITEESKKLNESLSRGITLAITLKTSYESLNSKQIEIQKERAQNSIDDSNCKLARLEQDKECVTYKKEQNRLINEETEIVKLTKELENQQSEYLDKYFTDLNDYFNQLGSRDFTLTRAESGRGYQKVYYLDVSFKGEPISTEHLNIVFSDSDKRSLALAIFLAKTKQIDEKDKIILVLDDPVVSFDDNRIKITADIVLELSREFGQIIMLSHYGSFISRLAGVKISDATYFNITKDSKTCSFEPYDVKKLTMSKMERAFEKIWGYIKREHTDDITQDCRVFLENYLTSRFKKDIKEKGILYSNLRELITELKENSVINEQTYNKLEDYRKGTNPEHHEFQLDGSPEDIIKYTAKMLDFIYKL